MTTYFPSLVRCAVSLALLVPLASACSSTETSSNGDDQSTEEADIKSGKKKTCASVGGQCVGLSPTSCPSGRWGDANLISCGAGVGAGCCLAECPSLSPPAPGFCAGGTITPTKDATGCTIGYDCAPAPAQNACEQAGGECVGLSPTSCPSGRWGDASTLSCGPGIGAGCCLAACPQLNPPGPGFCPGGTITPKKDATGCTVGFDCASAPPNACEQGGGQCVGLSPSSCPSGNWADASTHSCGGRLGVGCCLP